MSFTTLTFALFFSGSFLAYNFTSQRFRWALLVLASFGFYAGFHEPLLLLVLLWVILTAYVLAQVLQKVKSPRLRVILLAVGIVSSSSPLILLRYVSHMFAISVGAIGIPTSFLGLTVTTIGVSFFSLQAISYLVDVYLQVVTAETHLGYLALYFSFFPKLLQGPIERAEDLLPQLRTQYVLNYENVRSGLLLCAWGLFKKVVIADRLAPLVSRVYDHPHDYVGLPLAIATYLYAAQLYCDFSGYTDIAIGSARLMNIRLRPNFRSPYVATSIMDFWRRWHISLSSWLLDYLFTPLQLALRGMGSFAVPLALMVTFIVCGLWHGPNWTFVSWGALNGIYIIASLWTKGIRSRLVKLTKLDQAPVLLEYIRISICFHLVCLGWIFFRAGSLSDALYILTHIFSGLGESVVHVTAWQLTAAHGLSGESWVEILPAVFGLVLMMVIHPLERGGAIEIVLFEKPFWFRWSAYYGIVFYILVFGVFRTSQFLYFVF